MTLDALAFEAQLQEPFAVVTDARRREVFWARYNADGSRSAGPSVDAPGTVVDEVGHLPSSGSWCNAVCRTVRRRPWTRSAFCDCLGFVSQQFAGQREALRLPPDPLYLRRPDVTPAGAAKSVLT